MEFTDLTEKVAVDLNYDTVETYDAEMNYLGYLNPDSREALIGSFLVVTREGPKVLSAIEFHQKYQFYTPDQASRTTLRTITHKE